MSKETHDKAMSRREFMERIIKAGITIAAAGALGLQIHDPHGPYAGGASGPARLGNYKVRGLDERMAIIHGSDRRQALRRAVKAIGGIESFIKPSDRVLIKVNAAFALPAILNANAHPDVVSEMIRLCHEAGAKDVRVTDNPINDPASCFQLSGIKDAVEKSGGRLYMPRESYFRPLTLPGGSLIRDWPVLYEPFEDVTKLIGISPVKDHHRSGASMSLKNWYGLLGGRRNIFHQDIHTIIMELAMLARPTFVILDGTMTMMTNGPTGGSLADLKQTDVMIASTDPVAADAFGATLLERPLTSLPFIAKAAEAGVGTLDYESLRPERVSLEDEHNSTQEQGA
ncbi:MAG TPA: DUF362 domain-containing protein [Candidatus Sumerlaeota bacterium]|nr:DUF362 domain-containing protein [Candidatus Sumerlaeota bacterium]